MLINWVILQSAVKQLAGSMRNGSTRELEAVVLVGFAGTDSFKLTYAAAESGAITRGTNYNAAGIKAAIEAIAGFTDTVTVSDVTDSAFMVQFDTPGTVSSVLSVTNPTGCTGTVGVLVAGSNADPDDSLSFKGAIAKLFTNAITVDPLTDPATLTQPTFDGYAASAGIEWDTPYVGVLGAVTFLGNLIQWTCTGPTVSDVVRGIMLEKDGDVIAVGNFVVPVPVQASGDVVIVFPQVNLPVLQWQSAA